VGACVFSDSQLLADAVRIIGILCEHLPDAGRPEDCWDWCWEELDDKAQDAVKQAREKAVAFLLLYKKSKGNEAEADAP